MVAISVVSPSLNQKRFVQRTLDSVASQDFKDYEFVVFDGGSTDGTLDVLRAAEKSNTRMALHVGRDTGQANAINLGLREARGEIVTWLNTDDAYVGRKVLSEVVDIFGRNPEVDVVYGRGRFVAPEGEVLRDVYINSEPERLIYRFISSNGILQPALFFKRALLDRFGYLDEGMSCAFDYEYWVRLITGGAKFAFHDKVLVDATWHEDMKTSRTRGKSFDESIEVVRRHYGFSPMDWIERLAGHQVAGSDFVINDNSRNNPKVAKETREVADADFRKRNAGKAAKSAILKWAHAPETAKSLAAFRAASGLDWKRVVVTTFNAPYFEQGLTLIASLHRTGQGLPILVYDLGLTEWQRGHIATLRDVFVIDYPKDIAPAYPEFFDPKSYVYKILAMDHAAKIAEPKGTVLFIDAGVSVVEGVLPVFARIDADGVFFVDHDDKAPTPLRNITFASDASIEAMDATNDELVGTHLCSCLMGFQVGGRSQALFAEALQYAGDPRASLGDKHPVEPVRILPAQTPGAGGDRQRAIDDPAFRAKLSRADMRRLFGYLGHRQDQTIISVLAARHGAPILSARAWCISNDASSDASRKNWDARGDTLTVKSSRDAETTFERSVTIHHRGLYVNLEGMDYDVTRTAPAIVLGNGPSLKGFDFARFKPFDVFGMNAAYRYWDEIGWYPRYYSCLDLVVGMSHAEHIARLIDRAPEYGIERFLLRRNLINHIGPIRNSDRIVDFDLLRKGTRQFSRLPITTGSHTLIWAAALGYRDLYLMGVDCNYVEMVPGAERREGTALEITASAGDNPNYFFTGYQQVGDKYNVPNSSPDLHIESWRAAALSLQDFGATALNANPKSRVDAFDFVEFDALEKGGRVPIIPRSKVVGGNAFYVPAGFASTAFEHADAAQIDEPALVFEVMKDSAPGSVMIDVGAHRGGSLMRFAKAGWTVHAFEPDPQNRQRLSQTFGSSPNVHISPDAVAGVSGQEVPFFASDESSGISSLTAFHTSHREVARVRTVTLDEIVKRRNLSRIDFLKIDIEGWELPALRALDFDKIEPRAIVAEFEDSKTAPQGYDVHDMAQLLVDKGYVVFVSEWYPIERYGVRHSFRRISKYPCSVPGDSWGNLIAFREEPATSVLRRAIRSSVDRKITFEGELEGEDEEPVATKEGNQLTHSTQEGGMAAAVSAPAHAAPAGSPPVGETRKVNVGQPPTKSASRPAPAAPAPSSPLRSAPPSSEGGSVRANITRFMRRSPFISAFAVTAVATAISLPFTWPLLSLAGTPEVILAALIANLALTAFVGRIVRKSLVSRVTELSRRTEDLARQLEARQQHTVRNQLAQFEDRLLNEVRRRDERDRDGVSALRQEIREHLAAAEQPRRDSSTGRNGSKDSSSPPGGISTSAENDHTVAHEPVSEAPPELRR